MTPIFFEKDMAVKYWEKLGKSEAPDIEVPRPPYSPVNQPMFESKTVLWIELPC